MQIKLMLCQSCAEKLRRVRDSEGEHAMGRAVGPTLSKCPECSKQLPAPTVETRLKRRSPPPS